MLKYIKKIVWKVFVEIDTLLKFPNLKKGEIGIQLGFDIKAPVTTDLFSIYKRVKPNGLVVGVDPDPRNIQLAQVLIDKKNLNIKLIQKAIYSEKGECELLLGESASWNQLSNIPIDSTVKFTDETITVEMDSLDNIVKVLNIDINKIGHINFTINGAEFEALKGMHKILSEVKYINLTIVAGRYDESGTIDNRPDFEVIIEHLHKYGFTTKFKRIHQLLWWGFFVKTILNRKWIYGKKNYGVIMATKGNKKHKWYQSYS
ncbi:MAG: FkbM family methyltransferase [Bacteroidales bacterium]|jgi:FkbM family methyltransferase|nr:FkbM family methyltransferase [Bacteroidales bacterium]